ncbi:MAG: c-type cytochrome [Dongiaceae bacterium]
MAGAVALTLIGVDTAQTADPAAGRDKAKVCRACHGLDGVARLPTAATIAGESELYLAKQLKAFRSGERQDPQMVVIAKKLSDDDIADLAAWYASIEITVKVPE